MVVRWPSAAEGYSEGGVTMHKKMDGVETPGAYVDD